MRKGRTLVHVERTLVRVAQLSEEDIAWYVATGEPADKAGAYAIQGLGSRFIEGIDGSYSNVVGLPISSVYEGLKGRSGCDTLGSTKTAVKPRQFKTFYDAQICEDANSYDSSQRFVLLSCVRWVALVLAAAGHGLLQACG